MINIYHEAPLTIFDRVQCVTDGDYALVHLLDQEPAYASKFIEVRHNPGRKLILDNSAYELGSSFDPDVLAAWAVVLQPDVYVVPDVIGNASHTVDAFSDWLRTYPKIPGRKMGVLQGSTPREAVNCFKQLKALGADIIGIPFLIGRGFDSDNGHKPSNLDLMRRRVGLVELIMSECEAHPIHLLGVALPQEGVYYRDLSWVESVDTSNPVVHGMFGIRYAPDGLLDKRSELLADLIHREVSIEEILTIFDNIRAFKAFWTKF